MPDTKGRDTPELSQLLSSQTPYNPFREVVSQLRVPGLPGLRAGTDWLRVLVRSGNASRLSHAQVVASDPGSVLRTS